jgi:hypothetical protein
VAWACACACSLFKNKKNKSLREARGVLPGSLCACACSLFKNKKKYTQEGDKARGGPAGLLCASA